MLFQAKWRGAHSGSPLTPAAGAACDLTHYWALRAEDVADALGSSGQGLSTLEAAARLRTYGPNRLRSHEVASFLQTLVNQIKSPLLLLLVFAAGASIASRELIDATIVLTIVAATIAIGFYRESTAQTAIAALRSKVHTRSDVARDGGVTSIGAEDIVPGDVVHLSAGDLVPADGSRPGALLLWSTIATIVLACAIPFLPFANVFGFVPLPARLLVVIAGITIAYVAATELAKRWFYDRRNEGLSTSEA